LMVRGCIVADSFPVRAMQKPRFSDGVCP